jgi:hypothetical protein
LNRSIAVPRTSRRNDGEAYNIYSRLILIRCVVARRTVPGSSLAPDAGYRGGLHPGHPKVGLAFACWPGVEATEAGWVAAEALQQERY